VAPVGKKRKGSKKDALKSGVVGGENKRDVRKRERTKGIMQSVTRAAR